MQTALTAMMRLSRRGPENLFQYFSRVIAKIDAVVVSWAGE
jgi:hypothetical protein